MPTIEAIALYELLGTRPSVLAPCADAGVRPAEARENLLVVATDDGRRGIAHWADPSAEHPPAELGAIVGSDPRALFRWDGACPEPAAPEIRSILRTCPPLDLALLDLCGQIEGVPLWRLLGPEQRDCVPVCYSALHFEDLLNPDSTVECVVERAREAVADGHRALKIKVGRGLKWMPWPECTERDIEVVRAVRRAVGPEIALAIDGDHGYAGYVADAADFLAEVAPVELEYVDSLVGEHEVSDLRDILRASGLHIPLAGGRDWDGYENCAANWPRSPFDILHLDTCRIGILEHLRVAHFGHEHGLGIAPHNFGSQIGLLAGLHLGKTAPAFSRCECDDSRFEDYQAPGYTLDDGRYRVPDSPGLGVVTSSLDPTPRASVCRGRRSCSARPEGG